MFQIFSSGSNSSGMRRSIVASQYDILALSSPAASFLRTPSLMSSVSRFEYIASSVPKRRMSSSAVFSPTPGTPGILSDMSPIRDFRSTMRSGSKPYSSRKREGS